MTNSRTIAPLGSIEAKPATAPSETAATHADHPCRVHRPADGCIPPSTSQAAEPCSVHPSNIQAHVRSIKVPVNASLTERGMRPILLLASTASTARNVCGSSIKNAQGMQTKAPSSIHFGGDCVSKNMQPRIAPVQILVNVSTNTLTTVGLIATPNWCSLPARSTITMALPGTYLPR